MEEAWGAYEEYLRGIGLCPPNVRFKSRSKWDFNREAKDIAWELALKKGQISPGVDPNDYDFHHDIPVEIARLEGYDPAEISNAANAVVLPRGKHVDLHRKNSNQQLAATANYKPKQRRLV